MYIPKKCLLFVFLLYRRSNIDDARLAKIMLASYCANVTNSLPEMCDLACAIAGFVSAQCMVSVLGKELKL